MKHLSPLLLTIALLGYAQDIPSIKGHKIGEEITDFLVVETGSTEKAANTLTDCATLLDNTKPVRKLEYRAETCKQIADVLEGRPAVLIGETKGGKYQFQTRKLMAIELRLALDFSVVERDLIEKFGKPDSEEQIAYENGFGAVFYHPRATWSKRADVIVMASEEAEATPAWIAQIMGARATEQPVNLIRVEIKDRAFVNSLIEQEREQPNHLN